MVWQDPHTPEFLTRVRKRMAEMDSWPKELRELAHEYNFGLVRQFVMCGVKKAAHVRHLIQAVQEGSAAYSNGGRQNFCYDCPHKFQNPASPGSAAGKSASNPEPLSPAAPLSNTGG